MSSCKDHLPEERPEDVVIDYHRYHPDQPLSQHLRLQAGKGQSFFERSFDGKIDRMQLRVKAALIDTVYKRLIAYGLDDVTFTTKGDVHSMGGTKLVIQWGGGERLFIERGDTMINPEFRGAWLKSSQLLDSVLTTLVEQQLEKSLTLKLRVDLPEDTEYNVQMNGGMLAGHSLSNDTTFFKPLRLTPGELTLNASVKQPRKKTKYRQEKLDLMLGNQFDSVLVDLRLIGKQPTLNAQLK